MLEILGDDGERQVFGRRGAWFVSRSLNPAFLWGNKKEVKWLLLESSGVETRV
jgi:hypothetical protein